MKIPKSHFERFKKEFLRWQQLLGLTQYRIQFDHSSLPNDYARIDIDESGKVGVVRLAISTGKYREGVDGYAGPELHARHEAIHLLIFRLECLAKQRCVLWDDINEEGEAIVRRLEKVLK